MKLDSSERDYAQQEKSSHSTISKRVSQKHPGGASRKKTHTSSTKSNVAKKSSSKDGTRARVTSPRTIKSTPGETRVASPRTIKSTSGETRVASPRTIKSTSAETRVASPRTIKSTSGEGRPKTPKSGVKKDIRKSGSGKKSATTKPQQSRSDHAPVKQDCEKVSTKQRCDNIPTKQQSEGSFLGEAISENPVKKATSNTSKDPTDDSWISEIRSSKKEERVMLPTEKIRSAFPDEVHDDLEEDGDEGDIDLGPSLANPVSISDDFSVNTRPMGNRSESNRTNLMTDEDRDARDITRKMISDILRDTNDELSFEFGGRDVAVTYGPSVSYETASLALTSSPFLQWQAKISRSVGTKRIEVRHVDIQTVDFINNSDVIDSIKIDSHCVLIDEEHDGLEEEINGICFLRDTRVGLLIELSCVDDGTSWSVLVDQPRVPIGAVSALELPVGIMDDDEEKLYGHEIEEIEEACGLSINMSDLVDLSQQAYARISIENVKGLCPSPSQSAEQVKIMYMKHEISKEHLLRMRARFSEQREQGVTITMRVIPTRDLWKVTSDMKVICALFLLQKVNLSNDQMLLNRRRRKIADGEDVGISDDMSIRSGSVMTNLMMTSSMKSISEISEISFASTSAPVNGEGAPVGKTRSSLKEAKVRGKKLVSGWMSTLKESMSLDG